MLPARLLIFLLLLLTTIACHGKAKAGSLTLTWEDNSINEDVFLIEREKQKKKGQTKFIEIATVGANIDSYMDTGIEGGITYCYRVRAVNSFGSSEYSNEACGTYELVANAGQSQTISDNDGNGVEEVTLDGSGSLGSIVSYTWTESTTILGTGVTLTQSFSVGSRNITLTVADNDGLTDNDDVFLTILSDQPATTAIIKDITYATVGGRNLRLRTTVSIIESLGSAVGQASITLNLLRDGALVTSKTLTSESDGGASFQVNHAQAGCYGTIILQVVAEGLTWDGVTPPNKYCVQ